MMDAWSLSTSLEIGGVEYEIRTDFRAILDILRALNDPELFEPDASDQERRSVQAVVMLQILFPDFDQMPPEHYNEACQKASEFIDCGLADDGKVKPRMIDWEQDASVMLPAINKVAGREIRMVEHMHWWTFMGLFMEIGDGLFANVLHIRQKKAQRKKLEPWEAEFYRENKQLIDFKRKYAVERSDAEKEALGKLLGYKKYRRK